MPANLWSIINWIYDILIRIVLSVLAAGPMPKHIAFVMDGNRRYARSHAKRVQEGHTEGFHALHRVRLSMFRSVYRLTSDTCNLIISFADTGRLSAA